MRTPKTWQGKTSPKDLLNPDQASDALRGHVGAAMIRKRVRDGELRCYWQQRWAGHIFVNRGELMKLYAVRIEWWRKREQREQSQK